MIRKFIVYRLSFIVILLVVILLTIYHKPYTIYAAESSPSADIKSKLEELKKEIASKAAALKQEVNQKLQNKAYVGNIKTKTPTAITLATASGPKMVTLNEDTIFKSNVKSRKKFSQKDLKMEDYIAALGEVDEIGVLTAKKVILLPTTNSPPKTYLWGQIISISEKLATLKNRDNKNIALTFPSSSTARPSDFVIITGNFGNNDIFETEFVYVIPQGGVLKPVRPAGGPKKVATPSAQSAKSATPSAKKKTN